MRSAPVSTAASNTLRDPSMLIARVASLALRIAKARWTTTSAPFTASRTLALSCTSPSRYSVFFQPWSFGSNGRRAMPTIFLTRRERSRASTSAMPRSPVGPVTATLNPSVATRALYRLRARGGPSATPGALGLHALDVLTVLQVVEPVGPHGVLARPAVDDVAALQVGDVDRVAAPAGLDRVAATGGVDRVVARAGVDPVVAAARPHGHVAGARVDHVVAQPADQHRVAVLGEDRVAARARVDEVRARGVRSRRLVAARIVLPARACIDQVVAQAAEHPVRSDLPEQRVVAVLAEHLVRARAGVDHVL